MINIKELMGVILPFLILVIVLFNSKIYFKVVASNKHWIVCIAKKKIDNALFVVFKGM